MIASESFDKLLIKSQEFENEKLPNESEDLIWEQFKSGSQSALTYIYRNYTNLLFNYGFQFSSDKHLIKDCLQDLFMELIRHRDQLSPTSSIKFYLLKSFRNKLIKTIQKNNGQRPSENFLPKALFTISVSAETKMINAQLDADKQRILQDSLNKLPPLQREALVLYFYEGLKYNQIAEMLSIKVKSSRALVYRAIDSLGELLDPYRDTMITFLTLITVVKSLI